MEAAHAEERAALIAECATARAALREALGEDAHQPDDLDRVHDEERDDARATDAPDAVRVSAPVADVAAETDDGVARVLLHAARAQLEELAARVRELEDLTVSRVADDVVTDARVAPARGGFRLAAAAEDSDARLDATEARAETLAAPARRLRRRRRRLRRRRRRLRRRRRRLRRQERKKPKPSRQPERKKPKPSRRRRDRKTSRAKPSCTSPREGRLPRATDDATPRTHPPNLAARDARDSRRRSTQTRR